MSDLNPSQDAMPILPPDDIIVNKSPSKTNVAAAQAVPSDTVPRTTFNYVVVGATFLVIGIIIGGFGFNRGNGISEATLRLAVNEAVVAAGISNSEGARADMVLLADDDPYIGEVDAPITIVEFSAYACPYCGRHFEETLLPLLENYGQHIRYVYRDFPQINPQVSEPAALAANCANEQGRFWDYHDVLFSNQEDLNNTFYLQAAAQLDLDLAAFTECLDEDRYRDEIQADYFDGILHNISGTPGFYINGQLLRGALPYEAFERAVLLELNRLGIDPEQA